MTTTGVRTSVPAASRRRWSVAAAAAVLAAVARGQSGDLVDERPATAGVAAAVEMDDASTIEGELLAIDGESLAVQAGGRIERLPVDRVRIVRRPAAGDPDPGPPRGAVVVVGGGGLEITGDDLLWDGGRAVVVRGAGRIELPIERIRRAVWRAADAADGEPAWLAAVPAEPTADLVAVARDDGFELVECAICSISAEAVVVTLDGERIPVKRSRVLGLVWARAAAAGRPRGVPVAIAGGRLEASAVSYRDGRLELDGTISVPGGMLGSIDFAAARSVPLVDVPADTAFGEPRAAALAAADGVAAFFAPRVVRPADAPAAWLLRPRGAATWRIPEGSRVFRGRVVAAAVPATRAVDVVVRAEGSEWRRRLEGGGSAAVSLDLARARRLSIEVGFVAGDVGFPVRLVDAAFER